MRVTTTRHVVLLGALITLMAIGVPSAFLWMFLPPFLPLFVKVPVYATLIAVPLFIAVPLAVFGLHMFRLLNNTIDALDMHVKFDHLTGLLSRGYFLNNVEQARERGGFFLMIDADHFKRINDSFGHAGGDVALKVMAKLIQDTVAGAGLCGRLGGEELAVYLPRATREQARLMASALGAAIRNHELDISGRRLNLSVSIGVAEDDPRASLNDAMRASDTALYAAKTAGRDRYIVSAALPAQAVAA